jgi:hypothetical protein
MGKHDRRHGNGNGSVQKLPVPKRTLATKEDVLAAMLHEAKAANIRDAQTIAELRFQFAKLESVLREQQQAAFREEHGLVVGRRLEQDKMTGEFFWTEEAGAEVPETALPVTPPTADSAPQAPVAATAE